MLYDIFRPVYSALNTVSLYEELTKGINEGLQSMDIDDARCSILQAERDDLQAPYKIEYIFEADHYPIRIDSGLFDKTKRLLPTPI